MIEIPKKIPKIKWIKKKQKLKQNSKQRVRGKNIASKLDLHSDFVSDIADPEPCVKCV